MTRAVGIDKSQIFFTFRSNLTYHKCRHIYMVFLYLDFVLISETYFVISLFVVTFDNLKNVPNDVQYLQFENIIV